MAGGFTAAQWVELEHQALIFKYLMAGVPVPPDLLLPIRRSFDPLQSPFYQHSSLGYYAYYGKKLDPEPWRCRRTDGKKWRCAKEAYPDSKYCERHMHRGRNRSRKPVESSSPTNSVSTTKAPSSPATSSLLSSALHPTATRGFDALSAPTVVSGNSGSQGLCLGGPTSTQSYLNRYSNTLKPEAGEHHFFSEGSGTAFAYGTVDSSMTSLSSCKSRDTHALVSSPYSYGDPMQEELGQVVTISSLPREQQKPPQYSFIGYGIRHDEPVKPENQLLRPFFDEWPKNKESWVEFESDRSNRNSSFSTSLSISIPMGSSASSPNDE